MGEISLEISLRRAESCLITLGIDRAIQLRQTIRLIVIHILNDVLLDSTVNTWSVTLDSPINMWMESDSQLKGHEYMVE